MKYIRRARATWLVALALLLQTAAPPVRAVTPDQGHAPVPPRPPGIPRLAVPPECVTETQLNSPYKSIWAFVMNFEVTRTRNNAVYPVGCFLLWGNKSTPIDYVSVDTCVTTGGANGVTFANGIAIFKGGDVRCPVNIKALLAPTLTLSATEAYPRFELIGVGLLEPQLTLTSSQTYGNPILVYQPDRVGTPTVGLFVPAIAPNKFRITSYFNGITNEGQKTFIADAKPQTWSAKHSETLVLSQTTPVLSVVHERDFGNSHEEEVFSPRPVVSFSTTGGTFYIGGSPPGQPFRSPSGSLSRLPETPLGTPAQVELREAINAPADRPGPLNVTINLPIVH